MQSVKKIIAVVVGSLLLAAGINLFLVPFGVLDGGVIGTALIINYLTGFKVGLTMILCSIPIFVLAWFRFRHFFYNSFPGMLISSAFIDIFSDFQYAFLYYIRLDPITSSTIGGLCMGAGLGIMLRYDISTGGMDLLAKFLADRYSINVGFTIFILDGLIITAGGLLFSAETFFLSILTITAGGITTGLCCYRRKPKTAGIIP